MQESQRFLFFCYSLNIIQASQPDNFIHEKIVNVASALNASAVRMNEDWISAVLHVGNTKIINSSAEIKNTYVSPLVDKVLVLQGHKVDYPFAF